MTLGSLFDGAGTCCLAAELCGITPVWSSEIERFPLEVTKRRFPTVKQLGDVTKIKGSEIEPVDIISFGSPCQDLSVAGKRAGLKGERSGLFMEAIRIIKEMRDATANEFPRFAIWENVLGAFSSNKGEDFRAVLEEFCKIKDGDASIPRPAGGGATLFDGEMRGSSWQTDIPSRGASSMRNFGESPSVVEESSLSQILEDEVQEKYYLSETACKGVLRRAVNRGRIEKMPLVMKLGLILQGNVTMQEAMETGIFAGQLREITSEE